MGERVRSPDSEHERKSDEDKNSDSYYSDEGNASHSSSQSPALSSPSTSQEKRHHKTQASNSLVHYQATKKLDSKYAPSKRGTRWGFRSQSLTRDSPAKDIDLVTKRVLSARLLKINELRNELTELHIKLDELQKENRALKRLQHRQEKALNKFEDTENEISQLLARHNNEIRILRERLRKSQERERATERRLKDSEDELYRTKTVLQKLKKLSADKHLAERDDLAKKLANAESRLEDREKRVKDLERNLELSGSSFQRELHSKKKKLYEAQEENRVLQEELHQLNQKLKEKERELEAKNIYANRMLKLSPRKDMDIVQRKRANNQNIKKGPLLTKGVQTSGYFSPAEPLPESELVCGDTVNKKEGILPKIEKETRDKGWKEQTDLLRQDQKREREEKLKYFQEMQALEERVSKLHDEWERKEYDKMKKESNFLLDKEEKIKMEAEIRKPEVESESPEMLEERRKREFLLAKMQEIDREIQSTANMKPTSQAPLTNTARKSDSLEKKEKTNPFFEVPGKVSNGFPVKDSQDDATRAQGQKQQNVRTVDLSCELTFGSYVPSFGKGSGRPSWLTQKPDKLEENVKENADFDSKKEKKSNLMEQLFGSSASTIFISKNNNTPPFDVDWDSSNTPFVDKNSKLKVKEDNELFGEGRNLNRHRLQYTTSKPGVKTLGSLEDEIEEVILQ
ncbi:lebercilin [Corapipo altera]|uniref:lebercilin n=1 Tax=Corapipo altera TaxID=415028 RepID=UPI000FD68DDC|nr:lebercilin [Corapipo altera]XP_027500805.1 lebercilin [Corapipo altera]XP_027500807.1 lebercilin [Corapipo altera]XP_027500808.1 lebercilin [Corapipo altera]XP_027500809.1 lebercilin [Corapipo altera]XP_027500810.1 lebercilin [Corapipo altera]XP_027500811.1 lebercilin [Corapipo altera]XP_027500812.1 lebercilin [Corapipo altera]XP_027500813.1 lebercilin [Corapipo altera]XP_027500814.1 lebercilin [Corapipo altera]